MTFFCEHNTKVAENGNFWHPRMIDSQVRDDMASVARTVLKWCNGAQLDTWRHCR